MYADVLKRIQHLTKKVESGELLKRLKKQNQTQKNLNKLKEEKNKIHRRLQMLKKIIRKLYEDFARELLDSEGYQELLAEYAKEQTTQKSSKRVVEKVG